MYNWRKGIAQWTVRDTLYLSVVFTWHLPEALRIAAAAKKKVVAGGPAVALMPDYLMTFAEPRERTQFPALEFHNPMATFTSRGCPNKCSFCAVPKTEGDFMELATWPVRPIICDNNLLAASWSHFRRVIDSLKKMPFVDFQGLEAKLFNENHARAFAELRGVKLSFGFDNIYQESAVVDAVRLAQSHGLMNLRIYVLIGHEDRPDAAIYRLELVRSLGHWPFPQRFQPLYALEKNKYIAEGWTGLELKRVVRYYSRLSYFEHIPYADYNPEDYEQEEMFV